MPHAPSQSAIPASKHAAKCNPSTRTQCQPAKDSAEARSWQQKHFNVAVLSCQSLGHLPGPPLGSRASKQALERCAE